LFSTNETVLEQENNIKTVNSNEAIDFLKSKIIKIGSLTSKKEEAKLEFGKITHEKIINSDQLLTVIPLTTNDENQNSRILLLKIDNEIKSVNFSMYPEKNPSKGRFSGTILIHNLNGDFINGFRLKNGRLVAQFVKSNKITKNNTFNKEEAPIGLNEVIIINNYHKTYYFELGYFNWDSGGSGFIGDFLWDYGGGGGGYGGDDYAEPDPCSDGATTSISQDSNYISAINSIMTASSNGKEHGITLGKDAYGQITQAPMKEGGSSNVAVNTSWPGAFAAIHNHPTDGPLSGGDVYTSVKLNALCADFTTSFIALPDGSTYAIVVNDLAAAQAFVTAYPADVLPGYSPEFPTFIFDQIQDLKPDMGYGTEGRTTAMAFILDKYKAGITLLKQDSEGNFNPIKTEETIQNGTKTYTKKPCNN
jgi:hypothetical protein